MTHDFTPALRRLVATLAAAATAMALMTAAAAPVRADTRGDDLARALAAIAAVAIIGKVIHDRNRREPAAIQPVHQPHRPVYRDRDHRPHWDRRHDGRRDWRGPAPRHHGRWDDRREGSTSCLVETRRHGRTYLTRVDNCRPLR